MTQITPVITTGASTSAATSATSASSGDFSRVLSESMLQNMAESAASGINGGSSSLGLDSGMSYLQSSLAAKAGEGSFSQDDMLMFMMMMMMQEFQNSDLAPMMSAMMASLGSATSGGAAIKPTALGYQTAAISAAIIPKEAWRPTTARIESKAGNRSASQLRKVLDQFNVESAERYRPYRNGNTYCNIFVWDATSALNCEIPHYVDRGSGEPRSYPNTTGAYELDANGTHDWLVKNGANYGWYEVSASEAQAYANAGYPTVSAWKSSGGTAGHVQMVCPSTDGSYDEKRGVTVAQAGSKNFSYAHLNATMSKDKIADTRYFVHS